jgi:hypothetical protein
VGEEELKRDINGLGGRLNDLELNEAKCQGRTRQRLDTLERGHEEHRGDIKELFTSIDKIRQAVSSLQGRIIGAAAVLGILIPIITSILQEYVFKK